MARLGPIKMMISYSFTAQFLMASSLFVKRAHALESEVTKSKLEDAQIHELECEHKGLITSVLMQCSAALETAAYQVTHDGPGHHLGSNGVNQEQKAFLNQLCDLVDDQPTTERFSLILRLLKIPDFDYGIKLCQDVSLLVEIRNALVHYKPKAVYPFDSEKLLAKLKPKNLALSPFPGAQSIYFPNACLSASLGDWCVRSTFSFLDAFYAKLGAGNPIESARVYLKS